MKKFLVTLLAALMIVASLVPMASAEINYDLINLDSNMPVTKEPFTLKIAGQYDSAVEVDFENGQNFWQYMNEHSNINIEWTLYANEAWTEQKNILLASGDYPDIFFMPFTASEVMEYGMKQGIFLALNEYLDDPTLTPNINKVFEIKPELKAASTLPDGNIYGFGYFQTDFYETAPGVRTVMIREWAEAAGIDPASIVTLDDLYNALVALKASDFNGNGVADEIPWGYYTSNGEVPAWNNLVEYIMSAYGHVLSGYTTVDAREGVAAFAPLTEDYKATLEFLNKLWAEGLLDDATFTQTEADYNAKGNNKQYAFTTHYNPGSCYPPEIGLAQDESKTPNAVQYYMTPVVDAEGETPVARGDYKLGVNRCFISSTCENPEVAVRFIDSIFDPYVSLLFRNGPEWQSEDDYIDNGWEWDDEAKYVDASNMTTRSGIESGWYMWLHECNFAMGNVGYLAADEYYGLATIHPDVGTAAKYSWTDGYALNIKPYEVLPFPSVYYTDEQQEFIETYVTELNAYVAKMSAQFITGAASFDEYDAFIENVKALKGQEYNDMLAQIYADYQASMA